MREREEESILCRLIVHKPPRRWDCVVEQNQNPSVQSIKYLYFPLSEFNAFILFDIWRNCSLWSLFLSLSLHSACIDIGLHSYVRNCVARSLYRRRGGKGNIKTNYVIAEKGGQRRPSVRALQRRMRRFALRVSFRACLFSIIKGYHGWNFDPKMIKNIKS